MKCLILFVVCCGIALADNAADDCQQASTRMKGVREFTNVQITVAMLWKIRQIGEQLDKYHDLENCVRGREIKIRHTTVARYLLHIFHHQIYKSHRNIGYNSIGLLYAAMTKVDNAAVNFFTNIDNVCKEDVSENEKKQTNEIIEKLYSDIYNIIAQILPNDLTYKLRAVEQYNELSLNLDDIVKGLKKSTFGQGILPFFEKYREILKHIKMLIDYPLSTVKKGGELALQLVIVEVIDVYSLEYVCSAFLHVISDLNKLDEAGIERLISLDKSIATTCALLQDSIDNLEKLIGFVTTDLNALTSQTVFAKISPLGKDRLTVCNQIIDILNALKLPKRNADEAIITEYPTFDVRFDYTNTIAEIVEIFSENWRSVFILVRNIWHHFTDSLVMIFKKDLGNDIHLFISDNVQNIQFWNMTNYLTNRSTITKNHLKFEFDGLIYFEQSLKDFVNLANSITMANQDEEKPKLVAQAKIVFSNIQLVLYQLTTAVPYNIGELNESVNRINELSTELNTSNQLNQNDPKIKFKESIDSLLEIFKEISVKFQSLININKKLSTELDKNERLKFAIVNSATYLTVGAYNFVYVINAFLYIVAVFNQLKENDMVGVIYATDIGETVIFINQKDGLSSVLAQIQEMCGENVLIEGDIIGKLKKLSELLFDHNDICRRVKNRIVNIIVALPRPSQNETKLYNAYMRLQPIFLLPFIVSNGDFEGMDKDPGSDLSTYYYEAIQNIQGRIRSWEKRGEVEENELEITEETGGEVVEEAVEETEEGVGEAQVETGEVEPVQEVRVVDRQFERQVAGDFERIIGRSVHLVEEEAVEKNAWLTVVNFFKNMCC